MTVERASELVKELRKSQAQLDTKALDLFEHFVKSFGMRSERSILAFANMCGYDNTIVRFL